jgi:membrane glycosyltransferase
VSQQHRERGIAAGCDHEPGTPQAPPLDRVLLDWRGALRRVAAYLAALGLAPPEVERLSRRAVTSALWRSPSSGAMADAMDEATQLLLASHPLTGDAAEASGGDVFARWRLAAWHAGGVRAGVPLAPHRLVATPPLQRASMAAERFRGRRLAEWRRRPRERGTTLAGEGVARARRHLVRAPWARHGQWRRLLLGLLVLVPSVGAGVAFLATLPARLWLPVELTLAILFGALFGWISVGFWTALFGFAVLLRGSDRFAISRKPGSPTAPLDTSLRVAVVMPVKDEDVQRVFGGLRAIRDSLARAGSLAAFDFFVLSDSTDPDRWAQEEAAWAAWRRSAAAPGGVFYRLRRVHLKRKSGNLADFCRRFGRRYRYMVVLDADSVMSGESLLRLARMMESHPRVGIIQSTPRVVRARSLFARIQQFASRLYGPMYAAGMHYWQLGDSPYWGHNAIVRVEPFMQHCGLPRLSGDPPLGGDILSHDFVEAALLGRAGWSVWLDFESGGSYEETPGSLLEEMQRDQRWCQGNFQHLRLLFTEGLASVHRALFLNGIFSYVSAILWLSFLTAGTIEGTLWALYGPNYFPAGLTLFPTWPVWRPERVAALFSVVFAMLFLPKLLAALLALREDKARGFGGPTALLRSVLLEALASALFAPIRMAFYCRFILLNLAGRTVQWAGGADELHETRWWQAWAQHGADTLVASLWALGVYWLHPAMFWWLAPIAGALVFSVPLSVLASREALGLRARASGWLVTPEELDPPRELRDLAASQAPARETRGSGVEGFAAAVVDPLCNAIHAALLRGPRKLLPRVREARRLLVERALADGPAALSDSEKRVLLFDAASMHALHARVWRLDDSEAAARWGLAA